MQIEIPSAARSAVIDVKVFNVGNTGYVRRRFRSRPGTGFTGEAIEQLLGEMVDDLDKRFPGEEYDCVQVRPFTFNFVWRSHRAAPASVTPVEG